MSGQAHDNRLEVISHQGNVNLKTRGGTAAHPWTWLKSERQTAPSAGKGVETEKAGMRNGATILEPAFQSFRGERTLPSDRAVPSPKGNESVSPHQSSSTNVHSSFIHNCPKLEATHICISADELMSNTWYLHQWDATQNEEKEPSGIYPSEGARVALG